MKKNCPAARLTLIVEYDTLPDQSEIEDMVEKAREQGRVTKATLTYLRLATLELVKQRGLDRD